MNKQRIEKGDEVIIPKKVCYELGIDEGNVYRVSDVLNDVLFYPYQVTVTKSGQSVLMVFDEDELMLQRKMSLT